MLPGKRILLIISGGIAAYKSLDLIRRLRGCGAEVRCVLSTGGARFVTPLSVAALSEARPDPVDKLECFFIRTLEYMERHPDWARVFFLEIWPAVVAGEPEIRQAVDAFGHRVIGIVASGIENGKLSANNDPYLIMSILLGTMAHLVSVWLLYQAPYDLVTQGRRSMALMRRLIEPDGPGASK